MLTYEGAQTLDVTGPLEVFGTANELMAYLKPDQPAPYSLEVLAENAGPVGMSSGLTIMADRSFKRYSAELHTLLVCGGGGVSKALENDSLIRFVSRCVEKCPRVASICTGAFVLAKTGALDGKRATTHWRYVEGLQEDFPKVDVDADAIFVKDGSIYTSAGVTAGIDLALELVRRDLGKSVSLSVARELVVFLSRPGGQAQFSRYLESQSLSDGDFTELVDWLGQNLEKDISVELMAERCGMSPRNFARVFRQKMDTTPAKYLESLRLEKARLMMDQQGVALKTVIDRCGFFSHERFRRSFKRSFHVNPQDYQKHF